MMRDSRSTGLLSQPARLGGILGIAFLILFIASVFGQGDIPMSNDSVDDVRAFFADNRDQYLIADFLTGVALVFFFLPFAACLRFILGRAEGEPGICSRLFFTGAILTLAVGAAGATGLGALAMAAHDEAIDDSSIKLMMYASNYGFSGIGFGFALTAVAAGLVMVTTSVVGKWVGYLGIVSAVLNLIGSAWIIDGDPEGALSIVSIVGFITFGVWILATSIMLLRQPQSAVSTVEPDAA